MIVIRPDTTDFTCPAERYALISIRSLEIQPFKSQFSDNSSDGAPLPRPSKGQRSLVPMSSSGCPSGAVVVANVRFFLAGNDRFDRHVACICDCLGQRDSSGGFLTIVRKNESLQKEIRLLRQPPQVGNRLKVMSARLFHGSQSSFLGTAQAFGKPGSSGASSWKRLAMQ
jgi:hypothetical protein